MKLSEEFIYKEVCGEALLIPIGEKTKDYNGIFSFSSTGAFILGSIVKGSTPEQAAEKMAAEFEVSKEEALSDTKEFVNELVNYGILIE